MSEEPTASPAAAAEVDIYRDTPVRLLGYANEVGEAFRALVHVRWVKASYGVASAYVLADTFDKASKMNKVTRRLSCPNHQKHVFTPGARVRQ